MTAAFYRANARYLGAGAGLALVSSFGQTFFIALFADDVMEASGLTDGGWGQVYAVATVASAGTMIWAGTLADRFSIRALVLPVCGGLALACLTMSMAQGVVLLACAVFLLRLFGQGMLSHLSAVAMARWFAASRGKALAIGACGFALGQAVLPVAFVQLDAVMAWRTQWLIAGGLVLAAAPVLMWAMRRDRVPKGAIVDRGTPGMDGRHWARAEVLRQPVFWALVPLLLGPPAFGTALFFHQIHVVEVKGWALQAYLALMPLMVAVSVVTTMASGWLIDRFGAARLLSVYLVPFGLSFALLGLANGIAGAALMLVVFGLGAGAQATVPTAAWAELFGTRHLGAIKALAVAMMVLGSALGPALTGVLIDAGVPFPDQAWWIAAYFAVTALSAVWALRGTMGRLGPAEIDVVRP